MQEFEQNPIVMEAPPPSQWRLSARSSAIGEIARPGTAASFNASPGGRPVRLQCFFWFFFFCLSPTCRHRRLLMSGQ